jgi:hypothetical protein
MAGGGGGGGASSEEIVVVGEIVPARAEGRLTVFPGIPVPPGIGWWGDANLYYTPYKGNHISLFTGVEWKDYTFPEISIPNGALGDLSIYDVYAYDAGGGNVALEFSDVWDEWYERSEDIAYQDGVAVKVSDPTRRLLGTILTTPTGSPSKLVDSTSARLISNLYNAVPLSMITCDGFVDVDAETLVHFVPSDNTWTFFMPTFNIGNYGAWVLSEPRMVHLEAVYSIKNVDADSIGCAISISVGVEHDTQSLNDVLAEVRKDGVTKFDGSLQLDSMRPIGGCQGYQSFFAKGKSHSMDIIASDEFHGGTHSKPATYMAGWIAN